MPGAGRIDVHHHLVPPGYKSWLDANGVTAGGLAIPSWTPQGAVDLMDATGIATAIVSISTPGVDVGDGREAKTKAREVNEFAARLRHDHPERFGFFATLTLPDVDGALEEARYALDELDADGVVLLSNVRGRYLGDPGFRPLFDELDRRGTVVFVHPSELPAAPVPGLAPYVVDFLLDTTRTALSMARAGIVDLPGLRIILAHAGGFLPYAAYRAAPFVGPGPSPLDPRAIGFDPLASIPTLQRFYFDVALSSTPAALPSLLAFAEPGHVLYGSDFPYAPPAAIASMARLFESAPLPDDVRWSIDREAATALFPRFAAVNV